MDLQDFLNIRPTWGQEPCLYIIKQECGNNKAFRCGASGTFLYKNADLVYGADKAQLKGLLGRCSMYKNFWLPVKGKIFAALRIRKQLVATKQHKTNIDAHGNTYNVTKGNHTLVLAKEKEFHNLLDSKNFRWVDPVKKVKTESELFETNNVEHLINILRQIEGEEMFVFDSKGFVKDTKYNGGKSNQDLILTRPKKQQARTVKDDSETLHLKMTKQAIEQLRMGDPETLQKLIDVLEETNVIKLSKEDVEKLRLGDPATIKEIKEAARLDPRRSSRLKSS
jgi:hypothetical protein